MKAALLKNIGSLMIRDIKRPEYSPGEVLIKVEACSICSTDVKIIFQGHRDLKLPRILGHETVGTVFKTGKNVKGIKKGQRVQISPGVPCGKCCYCLKGLENMCDHMRIIGFHLNGGFASYLLVPASGVKAGIINPIPKKLSFEESCLAEPIACCINALALGKLTKGDTVLIFGAGAVGCLLAQLSKVWGASKIIVAERSKKRLEFAKKFGADYYIHGLNNKEIFLKIKEKTKRTGVNILISACADKGIPGPGIEILTKRGRIVFFSGVNKKHQNISFDYNLIHYRELNVVGAYGCTSKQNQQALRLLSKGLLDVKPLITHRFCLDEIEKGLDTIRNKNGMKVVINRF